MVSKQHALGVAIVGAAAVAAPVVAMGCDAARGPVPRPAGVALGHPLPPSERAKFEAELRTLTVEQLGAELQAARSLPRALAIISELAGRRDPAAADVLREYDGRLAGTDVVTTRLRGATRVGIATNSAGDDRRAVLAALEPLLHQPATSGAPAAAALKLKEIGGDDAVDVLRRAERADEPLIRLVRLELEYGGLGDAEFAEAVVDAARDSLRADRPTVAESSALAHRGPRLISVLERAIHDAETNEPIDVRPRLVEFLRSVLDSLRKQTTTTTVGTASTAPSTEVKFSTGPIPSG